MQIKKPGFHTIDALRFFAFLKVYLHHLPVDGDFPVINFLKKGGGGIGVVFFFVLSGFLITYNLVTEQSRQGSIDLKKFYLKRVLRIWPLFYLFLLLIYLPPLHLRASIGIIMGGYSPDWRFSFAFLENYKVILTHSYPAIAPLLVTWSLCIEEHFYIIWGVAAFLTRASRMWIVLSSFIVIAILGRVLAPIYFPQYDLSGSEIVTSLDYFAVGGLLAWLYAQYAAQVDRFILSIPITVRWTYLAFAVFYVFSAGMIEHALHLPACLGPTFASIIFAGLIAVVIPRESPIRIGDGNALSYLGRISYGLYLFHPVFIDMFLHYCGTHQIRIDTAGVLTLGIVFTFTGTVLVASFLYHFYEKPILSLKRYL